MEEAKGRMIIRLVGILGGLAAVAWALRERLITIDTPREEKPSSFRVSNGARS